MHLLDSSDLVLNYVLFDIYPDVSLDVISQSVVSVPVLLKSQLIPFNADSHGRGLGKFGFRKIHRHLNFEILKRIETPGIGFKFCSQVFDKAVRNENLNAMLKFVGLFFSHVCLLSFKDIGK